MAVSPVVLVDIELASVLFQFVQKHGGYLQPTLLVHLRRTVPRSFMRPAHPGRFLRVKRENVVYNGQKCPLSPQIWESVYFALQCPTVPYSALQCPTVPYSPLQPTTAHYSPLPCPTSAHFFPLAPHNRLLSAHVKRKHTFFKNSCEDQKSLDGSFLTPYLVVFRKFASYI